MLDEQLKQKINEYLAAIKAGDTSAINMLYDLIGGHLLLIARSYLDDKNSDEDIVAEVFRRIGVSIKSFDPARDGYNWLYKITKNAALSHNKSERRHKTVNIDKVANTIKVESFTDKADIWMDFCAALDKLDESDIELFKLRFIDDLPQKQLARKLHITESAVSQRVNKILKEFSDVIYHFCVVKCLTKMSQCVIIDKHSSNTVACYVQYRGVEQSGSSSGS